MNHTIFRADLMGCGYTGESRMWDADGPIPNKFFESRADAEAYAEPIARNYYAVIIADMSHNLPPDEFAEKLKAYEKLGGFRVDRRAGRTIYWGPKPEDETCRHGVRLASVDSIELH